MSTYRDGSIIATCLLALVAAQPAIAELLSYEGFAEDDYTAGSIDGQPFSGMGYQTGGAWNTANQFVEGGLTYPDLATTPGFHLAHTSGDVRAFFDVTPAGPFGTAGLIGTNGKIGGDGLTETIYYSVLGRKDSAEAGGFAGFNIYGDFEGIGPGEVGDGRDTYDWLQGGSNNPIGDPSTAIVPGQTRLFVFRLDFNPTPAVSATVWLDPDPTLEEGAQDPSISSVIPSSRPTEGFTEHAMRGTRSWSWDEIRFGTTWGDVTPTDDPAPFVITQIDYAPDTNMVTLTWTSKSTETYAVDISEDLTGWGTNLGDAIFPDAGPTTRRTFDLNELPIIVDAEDLFFRVRVEGI